MNLRQYRNVPTGLDEDIHLFSGIGGRLMPEAIDGLSVGRRLMTLWKCSKCGYTIKQEKPPEPCPSCGEKCEFLNATCYTPDCQDQEIDKRIR